MEGRNKRPLSTSPLPSDGLVVDGIEEIPLSPEHLLHSIPKVIIESKRPKLVLPMPTELMSILPLSADITELRSMLPPSLQTDGMHDILTNSVHSLHSAVGLEVQNPVFSVMESDTYTDFNTVEEKKEMDKSELESESESE